MNKKKLFTSLLCFSMLALAACGGDKGKEGQTSTSGETSEPAHVHTYSDAWSKDNNEHWHTATCGHNVEKDRAAHTMSDNGYCSVCGLDMMDSVFFELDQYTGESVYQTDHMDLGANEILRYRISGVTSGHAYELEDHDPTDLPQAVTAYTIVNGVKTPAVLDGKTALNFGTGAEERLYFILDASKLSNREGVWFKIVERHLPTVNPLPTSKTYLGFCSACGAYIGQKANLKANIAPTIKKGGYAYYRVELTSGEDTHYGLFTSFNEGDNEAKVEYFIFLDNAPYKLGEAKTDETKLINVEGRQDNYLYLVYSYTGNAESLTLEQSYVTNLNSQACDDNRWYYGLYNNNLVDSSMYMDGTRINQFLYIAFVPSGDPDDWCYEITVQGSLGFEVWQDTGSKLETLDQDANDRFLPVTGNEIIIKVEPESEVDPGGGTQVTVAKWARA